MEISSAKNEEKSSPKSQARPEAKKKLKTKVLLINKRQALHLR